MLESYIGTDSTRLLPLFWLRGENEELLRSGVRQVKRSGCGALCAESRTHPDYLGERWWHDVAILLDECKKLGMRMWLLDDMLFPSGYAAGRAEGTNTCRMMMTERHMDVRGPKAHGAIMVIDDEQHVQAGSGLVAVVAARRLVESDRIEAFQDIGGYKLGETIDITSTVRDGMAYWNVPDGIWRVFVLTSAYVAERNPARFFVNPLMPEGGKLMIETIYQPHFERFGSYFGNTFAGFFSDEPALRAGRGHRAILGEYPRLPIAWRADLLDILKTELGDEAAALLPGIWFDIGPDTARIRYTLMNTLSRLYAENYSIQLGDWCRAHGVEYIGHVIEQNNAHARLGSGAGHFYRAMSGQDMAGIDIVLHEIKPDFRGVSHAWQSQDFEADDDFFRYMLAQMAVSCAYLDPKKRGRTMCEIFGAYGWQEDLEEMRYLSNLMLSRGVNYFSPHAFSLMRFPDPDSPPHFFDVQTNPLMPYISRLFGYLARMGGMIEGGKPIASVAVLYFAEGEWANGQSGSMKTQHIVKALNEHHIECIIVPLDSLHNAEFDVLVVPWALTWPQKLIDVCIKKVSAGKRVFFVDALPEFLSDGVGDLTDLEACADTVSLTELADAVLKCISLPYSITTREPRVHFFPYERKGDLIFLLMNEDVEEPLTFTFSVADLRQAFLVDREKEQCWKVKTTIVDNQQSISVLLEPGQLLCIVFTEHLLSGLTREAFVPAEELNVSKWRIALRHRGQKDFEHFGESSILRNVTAQNMLPRFSGTIRYEAQISLPVDCRGIDIGRCGNAVTLWMDGVEVGTRVAPPYQFVFEKPMHGQHLLKVEVTNALVFAHRDPLSFFSYIKPTGFMGPLVALRDASIPECRQN